MTKKDVIIIDTFVSTVSLTIGKILGETFSFYPSQNEGYRLYQLQIWSWRYKIPLEILLRELLTHWHSKLSFKRPKGRLGVRVATLVGAKSKEFLLTRLAELYPHQENVREWQMGQQSLIVPTTNALAFTDTSPFSYIKHYTKDVVATRKKLTDAQKVFSRRVYRDSCWV